MVGIQIGKDDREAKLAGGMMVVKLGFRAVKKIYWFQVVGRP